MFQVERKNKSDMIYVSTTHIEAVTNKHTETGWFSPSNFADDQKETSWWIFSFSFSCFAGRLFVPHGCTCASRCTAQEWWHIGEKKNKNKKRIKCDYFTLIKRWEVQRVPYNQDQIHLHSLTSVLQQVWTTGRCPTVAFIAAQHTHCPAASPRAFRNWSTL